MEESVSNEGCSLKLADTIIKEFALKEQNASQLSPLTLAYIGDCICDLVIRTVTVEHGNAPVNSLHRQVSGYVKAASQMKMLHLIENELTKEEWQIFKRGRNAKSYTSAKNATIMEYRTATGFEALIGYLYLDNRFDRVLELLHLAMKRFDEFRAADKKEYNKRSHHDGR